MKEKPIDLLLAIVQEEYNKLVDMVEPAGVDPTSFNMGLCMGVKALERIDEAGARLFNIGGCGNINKLKEKR